jgi:hypothetical protein
MNNTQNGEDILKVEKSLMTVEPICFKSVNDKVDVRINENSGPELVLEDNTRIIFSSFSQYYKFISDPSKIYNVSKKTFNIEQMNDLYFTDDDTVDMIQYRHLDVYHVDLYMFDAPIYRLYMMN